MAPFQENRSRFLAVAEKGEMAQAHSPDAETAETIITNASSKQIHDEGRRYQKTHSSGNPADDGPILGSTVR